MRKTMQRLHCLMDRCVSVIHDICACSTGLFMFLLFVQVFLRYVFSRPLYGLDELVTALMIWSMALGFVVVYWHNEHATIEFLLKHLPRWGVKCVYHMINLLALLSGFVLIPGGIRLFGMQVKTVPLGGLPFPRAYYYALSITVMGVMLVILAVIRTVEYILTGDDRIMTDRPVEGGVNVD